MTSRERVLKTLSWQESDRAAIQLYAVPEIMQLLAEHFGCASDEDGGQERVYQHLGVDFRYAHPCYNGPIHKTSDDPELTFDYWGVGYKDVDNGRGGTYPEAVHLPLANIKTMADVEAYPWPDPDAFDYERVTAACEQAGDYAVCCCGPGTPDIVNGVSRGRGMEQVLIDIALRDEVGLAIIDRRCDILFEVARRTLEAGRGRIDILHIGEDAGNQNGRMVSPRDFEDVFRPRLQRFIDLGHDFGCKVMMHCCGDTSDLQETFIDMGLDILDAMQPEPVGMADIKTLRETTRGRLVYCGLISTQQTLPFGTEADCRAQARHRLDVLARGGGYIFAPSHCIQVGTPLENILAVYEEALQRT